MKMLPFCFLAQLPGAVFHSIQATIYSLYYFENIAEVTYTNLLITKKSWLHVKTKILNCNQSTQIQKNSWHGSFNFFFKHNTSIS